MVKCGCRKGKMRNLNRKEGSHWKDKCERGRIASGGKGAGKDGGGGKDGGERGKDGGEGGSNMKNNSAFQGLVAPTTTTPVMWGP